MNVIKIILMAFILINLFSCADSRYKNEFGLPVNVIVDVIDEKDSQFIDVKVLNRYIILKNYDFFVLEFNNHGFVKYFTAAFSKDDNFVYFLNYPQVVSLTNFNNMIRQEEVDIPTETHASLYLKFISTLFMPDSISLDNGPNSLITDSQIKEYDFRQIKEKYPQTITFETNEFINSEFYTVNSDMLLYSWQVRIKNNGTIVACRLKMMSLGDDYSVKEETVLFDQKLE